MKRLTDDQSRKRRYQQPEIQRGGRPGRPPKYTREKHERICLLISEGNSRDVSARASGIVTDTIYDWMQAYPEFSADIKRADVNAEVEAISHIRLAMPAQWQAAAWFLERRYPDRYGKRPRIDRGEKEDLVRFVPAGDGNFKRVGNHATMLEDKPELDDSDG